MNLQQFSEDKQIFSNVFCIIVRPALWALCTSKYQWHPHSTSTQQPHSSTNQMDWTQIHPFNPDSSSFILLKPSWRFTSSHIYTSNSKQREDVLLLFSVDWHKHSSITEEEIRENIVKYMYFTVVVRYLQLKRGGYLEQLQVQTGKEIKAVSNLSHVLINTHRKQKINQNCIVYNHGILMNTENFLEKQNLWSCSHLHSGSALHHKTNCRQYSLTAVFKKMNKNTFHSSFRWLLSLQSDKLS